MTNDQTLPTKAKTKTKVSWKTNTGSIIFIIGTSILGADDVLSNPELIKWTSFLGKLLLGIGAGLTAWGIGHKADKLKNSLHEIYEHYCKGSCD